MTTTNNIARLWFSLPRPIRFIATGGYNTAASYVIFAVILFLLGKERYQAALFISYILSSFNSYLAQKFLVFRTKGGYVKEYLKAMSVWLCGYLINALLLYLLTERLSVNIYFAQLISLALVTIMTYFLFKHYSFRRAER
ncbi:GtrA family protein [Candidatus Proelusimicrobium volucris]|uniref:GtrA family protein n=1 Tax=Candidatus Proelusimicrobium volucris TaxID=3416225 RepID=UPI003D110604